jgi:hypothetical protein
MCCIELVEMKKIIILLLFVLSTLLFANNEISENKIIVYTSYRYNAVPDFMLSPFFDDFESVSGHSFSIQTSFKRGNFAYTVDLDMMNLGATSGYWAQKDKAPDWFVLDATYLNLGINFEWFFNFTPKFEMISSVGIGFGTFLGEMTKYKTAGISNDPTNSIFEKEDLAPPFFGHLLIAIAFQYEVYKVQEKSPIYIRANFGFKDSLFAGTSIGYQF